MTVEREQVPDYCYHCKGNVVWGMFWYKGFENKELHIGAYCSNTECPKRWLPFGEHGSWIAAENLASLKFEYPELDERETVHIGRLKEPEVCAYKGCTNTNTQRHHIMPRAYQPDANDWPVVVLCSFHHDKWHALITTGLVKRARRFNYDETERLLRELGFTTFYNFFHGLDDISDEDRQTIALELDGLPWVDRSDAETALKYATMNLADAQQWYDDANEAVAQAIGEY